MIASDTRRTVACKSLLFCPLVLLSLLFFTFDCQGLAKEWPAITRECKPWAYWHWMGSAVDKENLTKLLEMYSQAGFGGLHVIPIYGVKGWEDRYVDFLSPRWMELFSHAVSEANRLGMGVDLTTGTGWPFGGPHVGVSDAAAMVVMEIDTLQPGGTLSRPLAPRDAKLRDKARLQALMAFSNQGNKLDLTDKIKAQGKLPWSADSRQWVLYSVFQAPTGQQVKRAAPGGKGNVMNYFSKAALENYLKPFDQAFPNSKSGPVRSFYNDSYEVYGANWTDNLFDEFRARRGYDLKAYLPALAGNAAKDTVARVKSDYRETIADLLLEEFTQPWVKWSHKKGSLTRNQAHGSPGDLLDLYGAADIPETEIFGPSGFQIPGLRIDPDFPDRENVPDPLMIKFASSAAAVTGKNLVASESCTWLGEHFKVALSQIKPEIDQLFVSGVNHIIYHGLTYSPVNEPWPGWLFYASTDFAPANSIWRDLPELNAYIARTQAFLQSGSPANDILLYFPIYDIWHSENEMLKPLAVHNISKWLYGSSFHAVAKMLRERGYTFDYISDRQIAEVKFTSGKLQSGNGQYKTIIVPQCRFMPVATLAALKKLAQKGATIIFQESLPQDVPGLGDLEKRRHQLAKIITSLNVKGGMIRNQRILSVGKGRVIVSGNVQTLLEQMDFRREPMADAGLSFVRRKDSQGYIYFLANLGAKPVEQWIPLGIEAKAVQFFDPLHGKNGMAELRDADNGGSEFYLQLHPGESLVLRVNPDESTNAPEWGYVHALTPKYEIKGRWKVSFVDGGPALPAAFESDSLFSWTERADSAAKIFAGTAAYEINFQLPIILADEWLLDLGTVCESARLWLNGIYLGALWCHPFRMPIGAAIRQGENTLRIEVTNLAANRIADLDRRQVPWKKFHDINFVNIRYKPFDASSWSLVDSGLLGPVLLFPASGQKSTKNGL